jgi:hypothetical protein
LSAVCPTGQEYYQLDKFESCPGLSFDGQKASCEIAITHVPVGDGCCIKARSFYNGRIIPFASMPKELKFEAVEGILNHKIPLLVNMKGGKQ